MLGREPESERHSFRGGVRVRYVDFALWLLCGAVWWLCAHSMTLLFPLPGPWLPTEAAVPTGLMMGACGCLLSSIGTFTLSVRHQALLWVAGLTAGGYLGWIFARGYPSGRGFLPPDEADRVLAVLICGALGGAANAGMLWLTSRFGKRPLRLLTHLLLLLMLLLGAVYLTLSTMEAPSRD